jgi:hypothetical protein
MFLYQLLPSSQKKSSKKWRESRRQVFTRHFRWIEWNYIKRINRNNDGKALTCRWLSRHFFDELNEMLSGELIEKLRECTWTRLLLSLQENSLKIMAGKHLLVDNVPAIFSMNWMIFSEEVIETWRKRTSAWLLLWLQDHSPKKITRTTTPSPKNAPTPR